MNRTPSEQSEFLRKALADEVTPEGIEKLKSQGQFGALTNLFPKEASGWAKQAGVRPEECLAWRRDDPTGFRAEVVVCTNAMFSPRPGMNINSYRIVRCNNVR
ncbi:MAG: hypothetical protein WCO56_19780 [Verrucomicrobiota bacterium]